MLDIEGKPLSIGDIVYTIGCKTESRGYRTLVRAKVIGFSRSYRSVTVEYEGGRIVNKKGDSLVRVS